MGKINTTVTTGVADAKPSFAELPRGLVRCREVADGTIVSADQVQNDQDQDHGDHGVTDSDDVSFQLTVHQHERGSGGPARP